MSRKKPKTQAATLRTESDLMRAEIEQLRTQVFSLQLDAQPNVGERADHRWASNATGHGTSRDLPETLRGVRDLRSTDEELDSLYAGNGLARTIVNAIVDDATHGWITIKHPDAEIVKLINDQLDTLGIFPKSATAACYGRLKRLGAVYLDLEDGQPLDQPVDLARLKHFNLTSMPWDSSWIRPYGFDWGVAGPEASMEPTVYQMTGGSSALIHRDRLLIYPGLDAGLNNWLQTGGFGESVIDTLKRQLRNLETSYNQAAQMALEHRTKTLHMDGFAEKVANNSKSDTAAALRRLTVMRSLMGVINGLVMGTQDKVDYASAPLNGYPELVQLAKEILCWFTGIPASKLFGEASGNGLNNGKGESQRNDWILKVEAFRERVLRPQISKVLRYLAAVNGITDPIDFDFPPLIPLTAKEQAEVREINARAEKLEAETAEILINLGIIYRKEARSRYRTTGDQLHQMQIEGDEPPTEIDKPAAPIPAALQAGALAPGRQSGAATTPQDPNEMGEGSDEDKVDSLVLAAPAGGVVLYRPPS